jgi:hypothetical protein
MKLLLCFALLINFAQAATNSYKTGSAGSGVALFKDNFYLKSGLGISQLSVDPTQTATPADAGHLLLSNGGLYLKKDAGSTTNWEKISSSGGLNLLTSPSFESQVGEGTCTGCTASIESTIALITPKNKDSLKMAFTASSGNYTVDKTTGAEFTSVQGVASCYVKTSAEDVQFCARGNSLDVECISVDSSDVWKEYAIPIIMDSTNNGYAIKANTAITDDIYVDECKVQPSDVTKEITQSEFVGSINWNSTNCLWQKTTDTVGGTWETFAADADCTPVIKGDVKEPATKIPAVTFDAKIGTYKVKLNTLLASSAANVNATCVFNLTRTGGTFEPNGGSVWTNTQGTNSNDGNRGTSHLEGTFDVTEAGEVTVQVQVDSNTSSEICNVYANAAYYQGLFTVEYIPPKSKIVAQSSTICEAVYNNATSQTISQDIEDIGFKDRVIDPCSIWSALGSNDSSDRDTYSPTRSGMVTAHLTIAQTASGTTNPIRLFADGGEIQTCGNTSSSFSRNGSSCTFFAEKGKNYTFRVTAANIIAQATTAHNIHIIEHAVSPIIVGKFKDIETSSLYSMSAIGSVGGSVTSNSSPLRFTEISEKQGEDYWSGTEFIPSRDMTVHVEGNVGFSPSASVTVKLFSALIGGSYSEINSLGSVNSRSNPHFSGIFEVEAGKAYQFRLGINTTQGTSSASNWLYIREIPTVTSIVKNLNDESFFKEKCQTKFLSANVSTLGNISDLTFNNLTVGKLYRVDWQFRMESFTVGSDMLIRIETGANTTIGLSEKQTTNDALSRVSLGGTRLFNANSSIVRAEVGGVSGGAFAYANSSWVTLCEQPESVIETTEF